MAPLVEKGSEEKSMRYFEYCKNYQKVKAFASCKILSINVLDTKNRAYEDEQCDHEFLQGR